MKEDFAAREARIRAYIEGAALDGAEARRRVTAARARLAAARARLAMPGLGDAERAALVEEIADAWIESAGPEDMEPFVWEDWPA
ncbi:MAG: hypothetical protein LBG06_07500 [Deltaproteobacteria bacterium]|jgi:hypothetical protein|nr:hypothetical protein [Deltaproteobacteria bacterium]